MPFQQAADSIRKRVRGAQIELADSGNPHDPARNRRCGGTTGARRAHRPARRRRHACARSSSATALPGSHTAGALAPRSFRRHYPLPRIPSLDGFECNERETGAKRVAG